MPGGGGGELGQEAVAVRVMDEMVGQQARRFMRVGGSGPPGGEMAHRGGDRGSGSGEYSAATPVDDIDMGVDLEQPRCRVGLPRAE